MDKPANPLEGIIQNVLKQLGGKRPGEEEIAEVWARAAGERAALHSRPVSFRKAVLVVNVDGSVWLYELSTAKRAILAKLDGMLKGKKKVKDIRFRIGDIRPPAEGRRQETV